jgi:UDP-N-acetylglucosamine 1-carboxyvinyltransferase
VDSLKGATVEASDLRAGAALCLAGLAAQGTTFVKNIHFIDRGYEAFDATLSSLGADISRTSTLSGKGVKA